MDKVFEFVGKVVITIGIIFLVAILSGTILWMIYDHIHALFPNLAINGIIAKDLSWWDSVCITWIFSILFKYSVSTNKKE